MTKRRLMRWSLILLTFAAFAVWLEPTRVVWGWLRGEAFYQGRPTSFWRGVIERDLQTEPRLLLAKTFPARLPSATWWERCRQWIGGGVESGAPLGGRRGGRGLCGKSVRRASRGRVVRASRRA